MDEALANLDNLRISQRELDELTGLDISETMMGWAYRQTALAPERRLAWLSSQLLTLGGDADFVCAGCVVVGALN